MCTCSNCASNSFSSQTYTQTFVKSVKFRSNLQAQCCIQRIRDDKRQKCPSKTELLSGKQNSAFICITSSLHGLDIIACSDFVDFSCVSRVNLCPFYHLDCNFILPLGDCFLPFLARFWPLFSMFSFFDCSNF